MNISTGKVERAVKAVIYGSEGIGKSTLASHFPGPLFIDTEGGTARMNVRRTERPKDWQELIDFVDTVAHQRDLCKSLIIDTADWAEQLCVRYVCEKNGQTSIEGFGYGKGYTYLCEEWGRLLKSCDRAIERGIHVVFVAHAKQRKQELPDEAGAFDRWEMKLSRQVAPLLKEWADLLLFLNYKTYVTQTETGKNKAAGGKRVMYTTHHPCWDAKNRFGLPEELDLDFGGIAHIFEGEPQRELEPLEKFRALLTEAGVTEEEVRQVVASRGHYSADVPVADYDEAFLTGWVLHHWKNITNLILSNRKGE